MMTPAQARRALTTPLPDRRTVTVHYNPSALPGARPAMLHVSFTLDCERAVLADIALALCPLFGEIEHVHEELASPGAAPVRVLANDFNAPLATPTHSVLVLHESGHGVYFAVAAGSDEEALAAIPEQSLRAFEGLFGAACQPVPLLGGGGAEWSITVHDLSDRFPSRRSAALAVAP